MFIFDYFGLFLTFFVVLVFIHLGQKIHKNEYKIYIASILFNMILRLFIIFGAQVERWFLFYELFYSGHLSFAFFTLLMFTGVFKHKSTPKIVITRV